MQRFSRCAISSLLVCLLAFTIACGGGSSTSPSGATIVSLSLSPSSVPLSTGSTQQLNGTATYSDGTSANVNSALSWTSSNSAAATVNATGLVTAVGIGSAQVTGSMSGKSAVSTITVSAAAPTIVSIAVTPASATISIAGTQQLTATATYSDSSTANITGTATWSTSASAVATVSFTGLVTGVAAGTANISASLNGLTGSSAITVSPTAPTLVSLAIAPTSATIAVSGTIQLTATATYSDGSTANVSSSAAWSSNNSSVASVSTTGLVTGVAQGTATISAVFMGMTATSTITVPAAGTLVSIAVTPSSASLIIGATQQLTATATYGDGSMANVTSLSTWTTSNAASATVSSSGLVTGVLSGSATITASYSGLTSTSSITVNTNIATWHADNYRSGLNSGEGVLTPQNVNTQKFGKLFSYLVDGYIYGQPLLVSNLMVNGAIHNVVYVATENDSVYAFDADNYGSGAPLWQVGLLQPGETPLTGGSIQPLQGVTSTPAIDLSSNTIYVVSAEVFGGLGTFRLHALDLSTGVEKFGGPDLIQASVPGTNSDSIDGIVYLTSACLQRAALLVANGSVFIGFGSCHSGWLLSYNAKTLAQTGVFNMSPNLNGEGTYKGAGGVWMAGGGPAADSAGNILVSTGNGPYDGLTAFGESVMKFSPTLKLLDHFTPYDFAYMNCEDSDLASGGLLLIPGANAAVASGKKGMMYLLNTNKLGGEQHNDAGATQTLYFEPDLSPPYPHSCTDANGTYTTKINSYESFGTAAYFNGFIYLGITPTSLTAPAPVRGFAYNGLLTAGSYTSQNVQQGDNGTTPFVSSAGTSSGIVWMIDHGQPIQSNFSNNPTAATLRAYDATNLSTELYDSSQNSADIPGLGIKFSSPMVANGKVFIGTAKDPLTTPNPRGELDIYGLRP